MLEGLDDVEDSDDSDIVDGTHKFGRGPSLSTFLQNLTEDKINEMIAE
jgi:hypothetical protein